MRHAAHGAKKAAGRVDSPLSLFSAARGTHGAAHGLRSKQHLLGLATSNGAVVELSEDVARRIDEVIPRTRREIRLERLAAERRNRLIVSTSLIAAFGAVAASMSLAKTNSSDLRVDGAHSTLSTLSYDVNTAPASRSTQRESIEESLRDIDNAVSAMDPNSSNTVSTVSPVSTKWDFGSNSGFDLAQLSRSNANNPLVADLMDLDANILPKGFNPNHGTGDIGNAYSFSQCTWWVYIRRHQLGLPVGSHFGNGGSWANSARQLGYWVDRTPRHVGDIMVFAPGQFGSDRTCGHVAVVEKINPDGSIETSECGAIFAGKPFSRTFSASQAASLQFIHY
ncbi:CHAP domain-containing protein [Gardnerella sp. 2492-Sm]|uniref:CHAP domain-containing protein n=1 Tax=unclassified Gardnerella TaxID=2628112 RepID=UPI003D062E66